MTEKMFLGEKIIQLRSNMGLSRGELAERTGIEYQTLAKYELNKRTPSPEILGSLAHFFGVTIDYLLGHEPPAAPVKRPQDLRRLIDQAELHLDGEPLSDDDREKLHKAIDLLFWDAKQQNKRKKS